MRIFGRRGSDWCGDQIDAFVDGELSPRDRERFELLLGGNPGLAARVEEARTSKRLVAALPPAVVPRSFAITPAMLEVQGITPPPASSRPRVALRYAQGLTAAAVVAFASILAVDLSAGGGAGDRALNAASGGGETAGAPAEADARDKSAPAAPAQRSSGGGGTTAGGSSPAAGAAGGSAPAPAGTPLRTAADALRPAATPAAAGAYGAAPPPAAAEQRDQSRAEPPPPREREELLRKDDDGGGPDAFRVAAITLGGLAIAGLIACAALMLLNRRNRRHA